MAWQVYRRALTDAAFVYQAHAVERWRSKREPKWYALGGTQRYANTKVKVVRTSNARHYPHHG